MRRTTAALGIALAACGPKVGPDLRLKHPDAHEALVEVEPGCRTPSAVGYEGCRRAAMMLEADPPRATAIFLATWENVEAARDRIRLETASRHPVDLDGIGDAGLAGLIALPILAVGLAASNPEAESVHLQAKLTAERMTLRVLRRIYEANDDEYSRAMRPLVDQVRFESSASLAAFTTAHMLSMQKSHGLVTVPGPQGGTTFVPPGSDATLADAVGPASGEAIVAQAVGHGPYEPEGMGPVPVKPSRDRWKVVEAGDRVRLVTRSGERIQGKVVACSERALAIQPRGKPRVTVDVLTIAKLSVR